MSERNGGPRADSQIEVADFLEPHLAEIIGRPLIGQVNDEQRQTLGQSRILITGAAGSIGRALSSLMCETSPPLVACLDNHENSLFKLRQELRDVAGANNVRYVLADVRDEGRMAGLLDQLRPDILFHLAAYKHVPIAEEWPQEFVRTNVLGTWRLAHLAARYGVRKFVYTSTDKAVNPPSVYGATKRLVELLLAALAPQTSGTRFSVVRLVNVIGARGGVVESFARSIAAQRPVTVTDARMTRYWITMAEALYLIVSAACRPSTADTLLLDVGEPDKVTDLAARIGRLLCEPDQAMRIEYIGIRPGERLAEELAYPTERLRPTETRGIVEARREPALTRETLEELVEHLPDLRRLTEDTSPDEVKAYLWRLLRVAE